MIPSLKSSENTAFCGVGVVKRPSGGIKGMAAGADGWGREAPCGRHQGARCCVLPHAGRGWPATLLRTLHSAFRHAFSYIFASRRSHARYSPAHCIASLQSRPPLTITPALYNCARLLRFRLSFTFRKISYNHTYFLTFMHLSLQINIFLTNSVFSYYSQFVFITRKFLYQCVYPFTFPQAQPRRSPQGASPDPRVRRMARCPAPALTT